MTLIVEHSGTHANLKKKQILGQNIDYSKVVSSFDLQVQASNTIKK